MLTPDFELVKERSPASDPDHLCRRVMNLGATTAAGNLRPSAHKTCCDRRAQLLRGFDDQDQLA
jgi:hypothetical protein